MMNTCMIFEHHGVMFRIRWHSTAWCNRDDAAMNLHEAVMDWGPGKSRHLHRRLRDFHTGKLSADAPVMSRIFDVEYAATDKANGGRETDPPWARLEALTGYFE